MPAVVGALAHQIGGMYEHLGTSQSTDGPAKRAAAPAAGAAKATAAARTEAEAEAKTGAEAKAGAYAPAEAATDANVDVVAATQAFAAVAEGRAVVTPVVYDGRLYDGRTAAHAANGRSSRGTVNGATSRVSVRPAATPTVNVSPIHTPVVLPPNVSKVARAKPLMPLSAAIAARKDVADIAVALGTHDVGTT